MPKLNVNPYNCLPNNIAPGCRRKLTKILVEAATDTSIRNKQGETALDIGVRKGLGEIVSILECGNMRNIISDLEPGAGAVAGSSGQESHGGECPEVRQILKQRPGQGAEQLLGAGPRTKARGGRGAAAGTKKCATSGRLGGCGATDLSSLSSGPASSLRAEHKYHKKARARTGGQAQAQHCDCTPLLEKIGKTIEKDKKDILSHLVQNNKKIETRLESFEKKTKNQMFNFNQNMKESFANERNDCQERMERRFLKDNIEMERQRAIRDIMIKRDIARWLQARLAEIETRHGLETADTRAALRKLTRRKSRREARAVISEMAHGGTLRRAHSAELVSDAESVQAAAAARHNTAVYRGLVISDRPAQHGAAAAADSEDTAGGAGGGAVRTRVRHNSEGNYDDVSILQETILSEGGAGAGSESERVYQNLMFHQDLARDLTQFKNEARARMPLPTLGHPADTDSSCSVTSLQMAHVTAAACPDHVSAPGGRGVAPCLGHASDTGSLDSHNDSGYSTRLGISDPASPSLSSVTDSEPLLDPQAIYMIPQHWPPPPKCGEHNYSNNFSEIVCNSKSSLV